MCVYVCVCGMCDVVTVIYFKIIYLKYLGLPLFKIQNHAVRLFLSVYKQYLIKQSTSWLRLLLTFKERDSINIHNLYGSDIYNNAQQRAAKKLASAVHIRFVNYFV